MKHTPSTVFVEGRKRQGLTQEKAAEALGVTRVYLTNVEAGRQRPSIGTLRRMAELYGMKTEDRALAQAYKAWRNLDEAITPDERALLKAWRERNSSKLLRLVSVVV